LFGFATLLVLIGAGLIMFGKGKLARGAGIVTLGLGLTGHFYVVKELKIDKLFGIEIGTGEKGRTIHKPDSYLKESVWLGSPATQVI
jgi:hypothetical protein